MDELLEKCIELAQLAGQAVMEIYDSGEFDVEIKTDNSPLTKADKKANQIIEDGLKKISNYPIISEEGNHTAAGDKFWLVDPIDGTKEFISHNGEFTICIGLVKNNEPVLGVVYAPARHVMYYGLKLGEAFKVEDKGEPQKISAEFRGGTPVVAISRSHLNKGTEDFVSKMSAHELLPVGSVALKICLVAEGTVSIFPRFGPTSLWDTAAADAIVRAAGGNIKDLNGRELVYDPKQILNPYFIAETLAG